MISHVGDVLVIGRVPHACGPQLPSTSSMPQCSRSATRPGMTLPLPPSSAIAEEALTDSRQPATAGHPLE